MTLVSDMVVEMSVGMVADIVVKADVIIDCKEVVQMPVSIK